MGEKILFVSTLITKYQDRACDLDLDELVYDPEITLEDLKKLADSYFKNW